MFEMLSLTHTLSLAQTRVCHIVGCAAARRIAPKFSRATWLQPNLGNVADSTLSKIKQIMGKLSCPNACSLRAVGRLHICALWGDFVSHS